MQTNIKILTFILIGIAVLFGVYYFSGNSTKVTNYPSDGTDIIAFGDSLVAGVGSSRGNDFVSLLSRRLGRPIVNLGRSGDTTVGGLNRIKELDRYNPEVVILLLGGNDYLRKIPIEETEKNLAHIIEKIHARGSMVLLLGVRGGLLSDGFSGMYEDLSDTYGTAYVPDVLSRLFGNTKFMSDAIHPNDEGYGIITDRIYPVLSGMVK